MSYQEYQGQVWTNSSTPYGGSSTDCSGVSTQLNTPHSESRTLVEQGDADYYRESSDSDEGIIYFKPKSHSREQKSQASGSSHLKRQQSRLFGPRPAPTRENVKSQCAQFQSAKNTDIKKELSEKVKSRPKLRLDMQAIHRSLAALGPEVGLK
jgi:hypothetical protein